MRRLVLGQVVATLLTVALFLGVFSVFGVWGKSLDARISAMAIVSGGLYVLILFFRVLIVENREWDRPLDVAFTAAAFATVALLGRDGALLAALVLAVWTIAVFVKGWRGMAAEDQRSGWQRP